MQNQGIHHHIHKRERIHLKKQEYPNKNKYIRYLDNICLIFSVLMPATTIPQIWKIYYFKMVDGVSLLMWISYSIAVIPFLVYGIVHKEKPLIILNTLWLIAQITIIVGILMYS